MENAEVAQLRQLSKRVCASIAAYVDAQLSSTSLCVLAVAF